MLLTSKLRKLSTGSALATLICTAASQGAYAAPSSEPIALSSDGSTLFYYDYTNHTPKLELIDTSTHNAVTLPLPFGSNFVDDGALSADGKTVVGTIYDSSNGDTAFSWTAAGGYVYLGKLNNSSDSDAVGVSADGSAIAGTSGSEAFYWKQGQMTGLGDLSGGFISSAAAISADGSTIVGTADTMVGGSLSRSHAFVWDTTSRLMQDITPTWIGDTYARFVSSDGSVVAGTGDSGGGLSTVFRWTSSSLVDIGTLSGGGYSDIEAMSSDGSVLVGTSGSTDGNRAYRYTTATGTMTSLGTLGGGFSNATGASADGSIVIGDSEDASSVQHGFRWTQASHMITVDDWIRDHDIDIGNEITKTADLISADGNVIIGRTVDNITYIARVAGPDDVGGTGIIDTSKFLPTIAAANNVAVQNAVYGADTIMFGAQGEPMRNLLANGQKSVWGTIDAGHDNGVGAEGGLGLGEFGLGYGIADGVTARFAAGGTYTKQDLDEGGDVRQRGFYVSPEVSADIGRNVYLTVGGYWGRDSIDSHRGYLNGDDRDYSDGSTNSQTWGGKIRLDWLKAATIENTEITPYTALSYAHTKVDGFMEDSGAFPVSYDATEDHATIARLGTDFVHPLTDNVRLLAKAEADYQFEDHAAATRGTIVGISDFDLDGQDLKHFWLRGGLGAEFDVSKSSTASVMFNATTQGQDPDFWVRTNFTVKF
jgi:probable HAF family extracellular repeat protein